MKTISFAQSVSGKPQHLAIFGAALLSLLSTPAVAEPIFARQYKAEFGYQPSCDACHKDGGGSPNNAYGEQFKNAGNNRAAFAAIAKLDGDSDGFSNAEEANAKANPGDANSTPKNRGPWLSTANLIPKSVQESFPGITLYKPMDAIYTDSETKRAAALSVAISEADETTIYLPVDAGRPVGTAIIVPGKFGNDNFYLLVATDRSLNVTRVAPVKGEKLLTDIDLTAFNGKGAENLPVGGSDSLPNAVAATVKKAAAMLLVRLKKG